MNEYRNISNEPNGKKTEADKQAVDGDKFKKALKVDATEEAGKRDKRNRSKKAEEEEDIDDTTASIPVPQGLFKEYMSEKDQKPSALDGGEGTGVTFVLDGESSPPLNSVYSSDAEPAISSNIVINAPASLGSTADDDISDSSISEDNPLDSSTPDESIADPTYSYNSDSLTNNPFPSFDDSSPPPTQENQPVPKQTGADKTPDKKAPQNTPLKKVSQKEKAPPQNTPITSEEIQTKPPNKSEKITKEEPAKEITKTRAKVTDSSEISDQKHQENKDKDPSNGQIVEISPTPLASASGIAIPPLSPFANMPNDVFQLFEKMVGFMQIAKDTGKSTTTVTLNMPNSIFNKCELVLEHYDTAPHAYNAQLFGNPEAIEKFAKNMQNLNAAITESKLTFSIHVLPPKLSKAYIGRVDRKDSQKDEDSSDGKNGKEGQSKK